MKITLLAKEVSKEVNNYFNNLQEQWISTILIVLLSAEVFKFQNKGLSKSTWFYCHWLVIQ